MVLKSTRAPSNRGRVDNTAGNNYTIARASSSSPFLVFKTALFVGIHFYKAIAFQGENVVGESAKLDLKLPFYANLKCT